jgi:MFS family permease
MPRSTSELLALPRLRAFLAMRGLMATAMQIVSVAVGWQVYDQTGRALDLGLVGLVQFVPQLALFPFAGLMVDRVDRRRVALGVIAVWLTATSALAWLTASGAATREAIFATLILVAVGRTFAGPTGHALLPRMVDAEDLPRAASLSSTQFSLAVILGPALGGLVYGFAGAAATYALALALLLASIVAALTLPPVPPPPASPATSRVAELAAGMRFIFGHPILLAAMTLDLFAVLFGGAVALLPVFARDILGGGPEVLGILRAAPAFGAAAMGIRLSLRPIERNVGRTLLIAVTGFGIGTLLFAASRDLMWSALALALIGATDEISVVIRMNLVQLSTPDDMRGRVAAAEFVFIGASNELGELESGVAAALLGPVTAVALGGVGSLAVVGATTFLARELVAVDRWSDLPRPRPPEAA